MINTNSWHGTQQNKINYGRQASKMAGGILSFTIALSNFITNSYLIVSKPWFETRSSLSARNLAQLK